MEVLIGAAFLTQAASSYPVPIVSNSPHARTKLNVGNPVFRCGFIFLFLTTSNSAYC